MLPAAPSAVPAFLAFARNTPMVLLTPAGVVFAVTEAAERALGCRSAEIAGRAWDELCADPPERTREFLSQCARTRHSIPGAFRRELDGLSVRFRCEGYIAAAPEGAERFIVLQVWRQDKRDAFILLGQKVEALNIEILRRKSSELQLAEALLREQHAQARLAAVLEQMPAGVTIAEAPSGRTIYANLQAKEMFGDPLAVEAGGEPARAADAGFTVAHANGVRYAAEELPLARALRGEVGSGQELHIQLSDGRRSVIRANAAPIRDDAGAIVAAVTAFHDVTEQKRLEQVARAAQADIELASRAKDEFLAMLGHELRNPLAPIMTALHLMRLRGVGAEKERGIIERQVEHVVRLVDDLLDVSRITRGKIELKRERVELGPVVARAIEMVSPLLEKQQHELLLSVAPEGLEVDADPARMAQVISNLLNNAAKYSERGAPIRLTASRQDGGIVLAVRDAGVGIAPEMLSTIFDLFVQERQSLDRSQGGLGIGLAIVRSLVGLHGGTVTAHSQGLGHGAELRVRLPAPPARAPAEAPVTAADHRAPSPTVTSAGFRVLVVDDNQDGADLLSDALQAMGHTARIARDGPGALRIARDFAPQMALLDIGLPVMDGYELALRLRQEPGLPKLRLVAVTGYGQENDRRKSRSAGFDAHLVKPVDLDHLEALVRELLLD